MGSKSIIKELFEVFFIERAKEKGHLYRAAVYFALALTLFSTFIQVILNPGTARRYFSSDSVITIIIFFRIAGVSFYSTVPTDEFDFFEEMAREGNERFKITVSFLTSSAVIIGSILLSLQDEIHETLLLVPIGIWFLLNIPFTISYGRIALKTHVGFTTWQIVRLCGLTYQSSKASSNSSPQFFVRYFDVLSAVLYMIGLIWHLYLLFITHKRGIYSITDTSVKDEKDKGFAANILNTMAYINCIQTGVFYLLIGASSLSSDSPDYLIWFIWSIADILPLVLVLVIGKQTCFTLLARVYELNLSRLQHDGAFLSDLVNQCEVNIQPHPSY